MRRMLSPHFHSQRMKETSVAWYLHMCLKGSCVASLYIFGTFGFSELQCIMDRNILFIPDKFSLTLWSLKIEISKGLNHIEVSEVEALFVCEQIPLHLIHN